MRYLLKFCKPFQRYKQNADWITTKWDAQERLPVWKVSKYAVFGHFTRNVMLENWSLTHFKTIYHLYFP